MSSFDSDAPFPRAPISTGSVEPTGRPMPNLPLIDELASDMERLHGAALERIDMLERQLGHAREVARMSAAALSVCGEDQPINEQEDGPREKHKRWAP